MPLDGFKRMMDTINSYNDTSYLSFESIIYAGGSLARDPVNLNET